MLSNGPLELPTKNNSSQQSFTAEHFKKIGKINLYLHIWIYKFNFSFYLFIFLRHGK